MAVTIDRHHGFKQFVQPQRCKLRSSTRRHSSLFELDATKLAHSLKQVVDVANIHRSFSTPCLSILANKLEDDGDNRPRVEVVGGRGAPGIRALIVEAAIAMASGIDPVPVSSGLGGTYYLCSRNGDKIAAVKPIDEEPLALNNPKGYAGRLIGQPGLRRSVRVGETGVREVAAFLLDHEGFAGVPPTALVKISNVKFHVNESTPTDAPSHKIASLQRFVAHDFDACDLGSSGFSVTSVHRIGILDVRLLNLDRHAGNILVKKDGRSSGGYGVYDESYVTGAAELVPIDHGLCLPEMLDDPYFEWLHWPQAFVPFSESEAEYICRLDHKKDAKLLRAELPSLRENSIRILTICTIFLKQAADSGLCLADIGDMMTREFCGTEQGPSVLETLCAKAKAIMISSNTIEHQLSKRNNNNNEEDVVENMFQFDIETEESRPKADILDLPRILQSRSDLSKPPKIPTRLTASRSTSRVQNNVLSALNEDDYTNENGDNNDDNDEDSENDNVKSLMKSMSFSTTNHNSNKKGGISFKRMNEEDWELFLDCFEKLLPKAFEGRKSMGLKQRLGTSCKF
ncbi:hypothetical protein GIB67_016982 [Kingdonia uniflora]|uniref:1-phosphatidylinositol 4-kinase n=1 Tax=Kingdonia uniflora TaxID=39325 RepID=A0A7J7M3S2_9MAGN|nr:hypothetical protein GIB67_016982 [Kingdonia uniflora]